MKAFGITDQGKVRKENQDHFRFLLNPEKKQAVLFVCDGMGGANSGSLASQMAADVLMESAQETLMDAQPDTAPDFILRTAISSANDSVYKRSLSDSAYSGMGTTVVGALVIEDDACVVNIGDSRAYKLNKSEITRLTEDHSLVAEMVRRGKLTPAQAQKHPRKNIITRALGVDPQVEADFYHVPLVKGDWLLFCSDGLSNMVPEEEILDLFKKSRKPDTLCKKLMKRALTRGAPDNVTVVALQL